MFFKVILECGHVGAGNCHEITKFIESKDPVTAFQIAGRMGMVKKKKGLRGVKLLKRISPEEYMYGKGLHPNTEGFSTIRWKDLKSKRSAPTA